MFEITETDTQSGLRDQTWTQSYRLKNDFASEELVKESLLKKLLQESEHSLGRLKFSLSLKYFIFSKVINGGVTKNLHCKVSL